MRLRFLFAISFFSPYDIIEFQRRPARSWSFLGWSADVERPLTTHGRHPEVRFGVARVVSRTR
jgi:hypothetical protein